MPGEDCLSVLPKTWRDSLRQYRIEPVERGLSEASVFHLRDREGGELYLKIFDGGQSSELRKEIARTGWLGERGIRVPRFLRVFDSESIVAGLMTALPGRHPHEIERPLPDLINDLAKGLFALHSLPVFECPFDESVKARLASGLTLTFASRV